jgi:hypothetical protein
LSASPLPSRSASSSGSRSVLKEGLLLSMLVGILVLLIGLPLLCVPGCSRTILVPESSPIRIGKDCRSKVYTMVEGEWIESANTVQIPEGWYCVPPSFVEAK